MKIPTYRPTWAQIDLRAIRHNFIQIKKALSKNTKILAVVKADAYGHGIVEVSKTLSDMGIEFFGVATTDEGIALRRASIKNAILILGSILPKESRMIVRNNLTPTVCTKELARSLNNEAKAQKKTLDIHVKVDTGMGRLGVWHDEAIAFFEYLAGLKSLKIEGVFTHLSSADEDEPYFTDTQIENFYGLIFDLGNYGFSIKYRHIANSVGLIRFRKSHMNLVRPGLMLYGIYPKDNLRDEIHLKPALSLKTRITYLKKTPAGRALSYGRTYITPRPTVIATLPIGYGDGYMRALSNRAYCLIKGKRCPIVGRVCMDQVLIDVGEVKNVKVGDEIVLIGSCGSDRITAEELAGWANTIPYETVCAISDRVPRIYIK